MTTFRLMTRSPSVQYCRIENVRFRRLGQVMKGMCVQNRISRRQSQRVTRLSANRACLKVRKQTAVVRATVIAQETLSNETKLLEPSLDDQE